MTREQLMQAALTTLAAGLDNVSIVLMKPCTGARRVVVLKSPRVYGEVACENADGNTVVWVDALQLLSWLNATRPTPARADGLG